MPPRIFWFGVALYCVAAYGIFIRYLGVPNSVPGFGQVYEVRYSLREQLQGAPTIVAYLWGWQAQAVNPFMLAYGMSKRGLAPIGMALAGQLYLYSMSGSKSFLFALALVVGLYLVFRFGRQGGAPHFLQPERV